MTRKQRSPRYPALSLPKALSLINDVWARNQMHPAPREVVVKALGYDKLHGRSLMLLAVLSHYGLLEKEGGELKVSQLALQYLLPESPEERTKAIQRAAAKPLVFTQLAEKFPGGTSSDELITNFLVRNGFFVEAAKTILHSYRETNEFVEKECGLLSESQNSSSSQEDTLEEYNVSADVEDLSSNEDSTHTDTFSVSMNEEFLVDIHGTRLHQESVDRLLAWLNANREFIPANVSVAKSTEEPQDA